MRSNFLFIRILSVAAVTILLSGFLFAQGKGHGGDKGNGGGNQGGGQEKHGAGNPGGGQEKRGGGNQGGGQVRQEQRQMGGWQNQQRQVQQPQRQQPQQPQQWQQQAQRQQAQEQAQRQQQGQRQQAQQWQQAERQQRDAMRQQQQQRQWQNVERQQQRVYAQPQQNWGQIRRQQAFDAKRERDVLKSQERANREDWKYERKQQHFEDKAFRKADRQFRAARPYVYQQRDTWQNNDFNQPQYRDYRSYDQPQYRDYRTYDQSQYGDYRTYDQPSYQQYYQPDYRAYDYSQVYTPYSGYGYGDSGYYANQRSSWVEPLIRSVIASFFSNGTDGGYYDDYRYGQPTYGSNYGYAPQYGYSEPTYYTFGYPATSSYYEPAAYYGYDQYAYNEIPYDAFQGALPYNDVRDIYSGGVAGELIQRALGTGYYQGLLEGQQARRRGWGDRYYADPYLYEQAIYDPYSSSIGDCRRHFSEGYEMGYQDALRGRDEFDIADGGDVDLVSLLMGSVLSLRG